MIIQLFRSSVVAEARIAQRLCWFAVILIPLLIIPKLSDMELTEWQILMTVIAGSLLMLFLAALSFLFGIIRSRNKAA